MTLHGAAKRARLHAIKQLLEMGLLHDSEGRKLVQLDYEEAERRLKERERKHD